MTITQEDVWGVFNIDRWERTSWGMIVARGLGTDHSDMADLYHEPSGPKVPEICPVWGDKLPYKSVTVMCNPADEDEVIYWLAYVHGANCVSRIKRGYRDPLSGKLRTVIRSDYMCW